jgi:hypothetical protein
VIYEISSSDGAFRQGEILSDVYALVPGIPGEMPNQASLLSGKLERHELSVIVTQDCDLSSDHIFRVQLAELSPLEQKARTLRLKLLPSILLCDVTYLSKLTVNVDSADRLKKNQDIKYQFLQAVQPDEDSVRLGLESMVVYFNRCYSVPTDDLLARVKSGQTKRRTQMRSPYFEHLSDRLSYYLARVGLPVDHSTK